MMSSGPVLKVIGSQAGDEKKWMKRNHSKGYRRGMKRELKCLWQKKWELITALEGGSYGNMWHLIVTLHMFKTPDVSNP